MNFESEGAYDFLIPSKTRGQSVIVRKSNGIIALIFEISKLFVCSVGVMTHKKYRGDVFGCFLLHI